ncbi:Pre-mRNA-splicing factor cef1 [Gonapodya sp. JEL0774]|nr:Pre-mRNA-splicing factor cef1 [Gonapodya sp. JEL0774]
MTQHRVIIKGGVWKNTEDEILKAAVMKYGKNQWARISSLLVRKTPKQCKARWYEWLDPSIRKTEWSKDEDEKLLHLAKLMPTQWRTIAPIVGRTPGQCLERYQRLLDEAELKDGEGAEGDKAVTADDVRRLRPGEIDPDPEAKPARPDPVDMDEDEKEMLSEARARLANTQGKKAKRKAREKQLEEAKRLAALQKRRELKAAGIEHRWKPKRKGGVDYNADIPFQKRAPLGFHTVEDEKTRERQETNRFRAEALSKLEGKRRADEEQDLRKQDAKKSKTDKAKGNMAPPPSRLLSQANSDAADVFSQRRKLVLPAPQISDLELEEIVKIGQAGETARAAVDSDGGSEASKALLSDYGASATPSALRTPRLASTVDNLKIEARNLRAMTEAQTPLLGGEIAVDTGGGTGFEGATPRRMVAQTPNPIAVAMTPRTGAESEAGEGALVRGGTLTGFRGATPGTPRMVRDQMGINTPGGASGFGDETPRSVSGGAVGGRQDSIRKQLAGLFKALPKPKNDFEVVVPEIDGGTEDGGETAKQSRVGPNANGKVVISSDDAMAGLEEDASDREKRLNRQAEEEEERRLARRSAAVRKELPRPADVEGACAALLSAAGDDEIETLVARELGELLRRDALEHPFAGQQPLPKSVAERVESGFVEYGDAVMDEVTKLLHAEVATSKRNGGDAGFDDLHEAVQKELVPSYPLPAGIDRSKVTVGDQITYLSAHLASLREAMTKEATRAAKLEKRLGLVLGGYQQRANTLRRDMLGLSRQVVDKEIELEGFAMLRGVEEVGAKERVRELNEEVEELAKKERDGQEKYAELEKRKSELVETFQARMNGIAGSV